MNTYLTGHLSFNVATIDRFFFKVPISFTLFEVEEVYRKKIPVKIND